MRLIIDMQGVQTESRFRGIGRYTMEFAQAILRNKGEHQVFLALSGLFPHTIEPIRAAFDGLMPQENIRVWHTLGHVNDKDQNNFAQREVAELVREAFLASLCPDIVHICSLFEGYVDDAVTSIGRFDNRTLVTATLYDLIPMINSDKYLKPNPSYATYYERKLNSLRNAKQLFAISEYTKNEGLNFLSVDSSHIIDVSTAIGSEFRPIQVNTLAKTTLLSKVGIKKPFVLYTGGCDERKNLPRLIEAWSKLSFEVRQSHQLFFAGRMPESNVAELQCVARLQCLNDDELLFSGYVCDEELVQLYNLCKLYVFPSWHEGFGLPALEAMACGAPVIGANTTSLPEVIGLSEALFDPYDVNDICSKIQEALTDQHLLDKLSDHGLQQSKRFSWDKTAEVAISAWEKLVASHNLTPSTLSDYTSDFSNLFKMISFANGVTTVEQLTDLSCKLALNECSSIKRQLFVDISELIQRDSATGVQRVVRSYLIQLLKSPPMGFSVSPVYATTTDGYRYANAYMAKAFGSNAPTLDDSPIYWQRGDIFFGLDLQHHVQLSKAENYKAMRDDGVIVKFLIYDLLPIQLGDFFHESDVKKLHKQLMQMIGQQDHAICISRATADAYQAWIQDSDITLNSTLTVDWVHMGADLEGSRPSCGLPENVAITLRALRTRPTFVSVSTLEPRKAQTQILDAIEVLWANHQDINLVLVGQQGWNVEALADRIAKHPENGQRLFWLKGISDEYLELVYQASTCLVAASLNEGFGLPLIEAARHNVSVIARDIPVFREVAEENAFYFYGETGEQLASAMNEWLELHQKGLAPTSTRMQWSTWQESTSHLKTALIEKNYTRRQLLVDISELVQHDARTGIQRVVRNILKEWLNNPPKGFKVEPVYASETGPYRYARNFSKKLVCEQIYEQIDEAIDFSPGDVFFVLDYQPHFQSAQASFYQQLRQQGVTVKFMVYDLLIILQPEHFPEGTTDIFTKWLKVVGESDGAICISQAVADDLQHWMQNKQWSRLRSYQIAVNHLGADVDGSASTLDFPQITSDQLNEIKRRHSFLMVGTIEPRKGHEQVLDAFERLWLQGAEVNLVIVGKQGWMVDALVNRLCKHKEFGERLLWLEGVSDYYLKEIYEASTCLISASYGEGFGLPLIEAAQHKLPIICRDIPVFREVAGKHAFYFTANNCDELADSIVRWLEMYNSGSYPKADQMIWLTWEKSAVSLVKSL